MAKVNIKCPKCGRLLVRCMSDNCVCLMGHYRLKLKKDMDMNRVNSFFMALEAQGRIITPAEIYNENARIGLYGKPVETFMQDLDRIWEELMFGDENFYLGDDLWW